MPKRPVPLRRIWRLIKTKTFVVNSLKHLILILSLRGLICELAGDHLNDLVDDDDLTIEELKKLAP